MPLPSDHAAKLDQSDRQARQNAIARISKLAALASAIHDMIEAEQKLVAAALPYATKEHDRAMSAMCRAAYGVFQADELHEMAVAYDPDWCEPVSPIRAGLCKGAVA